MKLQLTVLVTAAAAAAVSCVSDDVTTAPAAVVAPLADVFITDASGVDKYKGYNEVYDVVTSSCLKRCGDADLAPETNNDESGISISFVSSASDIAQSQLFTLDANVELALHLGNVAVNASMKMANKSNFSQKAVRMLLVAHRRFKVTHNEEVSLDPAIADPALLQRSQAASDAAFDTRLMQFMGRCGHVYAKEQIKGAYLFALYEFTSTDSSKLEGLEGKLGLAFKSHVGKIGAGIEVGAQTELNQKLVQLQWKVDVIAKGFKVNGVDGQQGGQIALDNDGHNGLDLKRIIDFFEAMQNSVGADMAAIRSGNPDHPVSVFTLGLTPGYYPELLRNVPVDDVNTAKTRMSDIQTAHERMMQTYGALADGIGRARIEIGRFMTDGEHQEERQIMKWPSKPYTPALRLRSPQKDGLVDRVEVYERAFSAANPDGAVSVFARRISDCWRWGRTGALSQCLTSIAEPVQAARTHASFVAALDALTKYNDTARPTSLRCGFVQAPKTFTWPDGRTACGGNRLPTLDESRALGLIAHYRSARNYNGRTSFWIDHPGLCTTAGKPYGLVRNVQGSEIDYYCGTPGWTEPTLCIDQGGVFPTSMPKLYPPGDF